MTSWSNLLFSGCLYALGIVGLFGITLLPLRASRALLRDTNLWRVSSFGKAILTVVAIAGIAAIALSVPHVARVFRCLTEGFCGPNRASGWFALCFVGAFYAMFEAVSITALTLARKRCGPRSVPTRPAENS